MSSSKADIFVAFKKFGRVTIFRIDAFLKGFDSELFNQSNHYIRNRILSYIYLFFIYFDLITLY